MGKVVLALKIDLTSKRHAEHPLAGQNTQQPGTCLSCSPMFSLESSKLLAPTFREFTFISKGKLDANHFYHLALE